jgi:hypothetical protein
VISALDALAVFVPYGQPIRPEVQKTLDRIGAGRWFSVAGGHELLMPFDGGQYDRGEFTVRRGGWDYETCSNCRSRVPAFTPCWMTEHGPFKLLCITCKAQMDDEADKGD